MVLRVKNASRSQEEDVLSYSSRNGKNKILKEKSAYILASMIKRDLLANNSNLKTEVRVKNLSRGELEILKEIC